MVSMTHAANDFTICIIAFQIAVDINKWNQKKAEVDTPANQPEPEPVARSMDPVGLGICLSLKQS